jgi:tRNA modification GTPase
LIDIDRTIVALATSPINSALGLIRVSGISALNISDSIFFGKQKLINTQGYQALFGKIKIQNTIIDEVVATVFRTPHSFTGFDTVEFSCHGSTYIISSILNALVANGAQLAKAGEFTQMAFLNGKMDLTQAEAVADLIASESEAAHKIAMQQMKGGVSSKLKDLREQLIHFTALIELELDFAEEDVEFADRSALKNLLKKIKLEVEQLTNTFKLGNAIKNGIPIAIIGKPNVGKSTLLNVLLNEERAIVSEIAGTTRDTIEETLIINGILFRFIDTAGIRKTEDIIEKIGVEKSIQQIEKSNIVLLILDKNDCVVDKEILTHLQNKQVLFVINKNDKESNIKFESPLSNANYLSISAKNKLGISELKNAIYQKIFSEKENVQQEVLISNERHYVALKNIENLLQHIFDKLQSNISIDLLTQDLKAALRELGSITGDIDIDKDILGTIFCKFCIGK